MSSPILVPLQISLRTQQFSSPMTESWAWICLQGGIWPMGITHLGVKRFQLPVFILRVCLTRWTRKLGFLIMIGWKKRLWILGLSLLFVVEVLILETGIIRSLDLLLISVVLFCFVTWLTSVALLLLRYALLFRFLAVESVFSCDWSVVLDLIVFCSWLFGEA